MEPPWTTDKSPEATDSECQLWRVNNQASSTQRHWEPPVLSEENGGQGSSWEHRCLHSFCRPRETSGPQGRWRGGESSLLLNQTQPT